MSPLESIRPYEGNPRVNDSAVDAVAASIRAFGFRQPLVVDEQHVIIVGHTRYKAAAKLGLTEVPVHVAIGLTPEHARAYRIADNQSANLSDWDYDLLPIELAGLKDANFDLGLLGFDPNELSKLLDPALKDGLTDPDDVPTAPDETITQPGDLWLLGEHRLLCGDSTQPQDIARLMGGQPARMMFTDPPWNVGIGQACTTTHYRPTTFGPSSTASWVPSRGTSTVTCIASSVLRNGRRSTGRSGSTTFTGPRPSSGSRTCSCSVARSTTGGTSPFGMAGN